MNLTEPIHERLADDATLAALLATYRGAAAVFTVDPAPGDADLPYIVAAGSVSDAAKDTKTTRIREVRRDVRCYAPATGSAVTVEAMAERARALLHRYALEVDGHETWVAEASGPVAADETDAYARIVTVRWLLQEV